MKKVILVLGCVLAAAATYAQGTVNFTTRAIPDVDVKVFEADGTTPLAGTGFTAQLYGGAAGAAESELVPLTPTTTFRTGNGAGYVTPAGSVAVPGVPEGGTATLQLRVWDNAGGTITSFDAANTYGMSPLFTVSTLGGVLTTPPNLIGLQSFNLVPEPSTILLGVLGAAALLVARRRK